MLRLAGALADGALPLLFPPEHYFGVKPLIEEGLTRRAAGLGPFDLAACVWVSIDPDRAAARHALARKVAYYGHALSPLIYERLGVARAEFDPIEQALMVDGDEARALALVDDRMLAIGVVGEAAEVIARLRPLVAAGARHIDDGTVVTSFTSGTGGVNEIAAGKLVEISVEDLDFNRPMYLCVNRTLPLSNLAMDFLRFTESKKDQLIADYLRSIDHLPQK